jgi:hypothetical protein
MQKLGIPHRQQKDARGNLMHSRCSQWLSRQRIRIPALAVTAFLMAGTGCRTVDVQAVADPQSDFSRFRTFNFDPNSSTNGTPLSELNRKRIESAIVAQMAERSCQLSENPDLLFSIHLGTALRTYDKSNPEVESGSLRANMGKYYSLKYDENLGSQPVVNYTEGTLIIRALETKQHRVIWESQAKGVLHQNRPDEEVQERIRAAIKTLFAQYPLKPTK